MFFLKIYIIFWETNESDIFPIQAAEPLLPHGACVRPPGIGRPVPSWEGGEAPREPARQEGTQMQEGFPQIIYFQIKFKFEKLKKPSPLARMQ